MYQHSNLSQTSTGSLSRRISVNNPFRSALLQEEARLVSNNSTGESNTATDSNYKQWLDRHAEEAQDDESDSYSEDEFVPSVGMGRLGRSDSQLHSSRTTRVNNTRSEQ
ncbi:hypothetical protein CANARDRAFT_24456 [[Candida] arabinofermentans NRRL YB-2248]|uniref:Uncharacterized protein n=1 Tax=[Candida] arabinofermentans NRRL YB-2248 TaxID=983967 RepID=A0A1E4SX09_9ASCO|nr:hypothetical protein CANARDRAFT_24456 [[Candida] arabinofermentans NRRL YB-2248]